MIPSLLQLLFMQYYPYHSSFYLYSILVITPASIYAVLFSSFQLLLIQYCFHHSSIYLYSILFITPASICSIPSSLQLLFIQYSFHNSSFYLCSIVFFTQLTPKELKEFHRSHADLSFSF